MANDVIAVLEKLWVSANDMVRFWANAKREAESAGGRPLWLAEARYEVWLDVASQLRQEIVTLKNPRSTTPPSPGGRG